MKASPLLRAWLRRLDSLGVQFRMRTRWVGWDGARPVFDPPVDISASATVLAVGGAS